MTNFEQTLKLRASTATQTLPEIFWGDYEPNPALNGRHIGPPASFSGSKLNQPDPKLVPPVSKMNRQGPKKDQSDPKKDLDKANPSSKDSVSLKNKQSPKKTPAKTSSKDSSEAGVSTPRGKSPVKGKKNKN